MRFHDVLATLLILIGLICSHFAIKALVFIGEIFRDCQASHENKHPTIITHHTLYILSHHQASGTMVYLQESAVSSLVLQDPWYLYFHGMVGAVVAMYTVRKIYLLIQRFDGSSIQSHI